MNWELVKAMVYFLLVVFLIAIHPSRLKTNEIPLQGISTAELAHHCAVLEKTLPELGPESPFHFFYQFACQPLKEKGKDGADLAFLDSDETEAGMMESMLDEDFFDTPARPIFLVSFTFFLTR
eukprot:TRINITY_DN5014_c0_g1_i1.p1 TRINITY_DN5014_c0_g1~~TRINITY_DN5014_c0_g1_i1.p1  ORF type:complete len:123 (+),score=27.28 TRINITY_DN5014_c0_g1_i1:69-437(+)